jgi:hypothetical protein
MVILFYSITHSRNVSLTIGCIFLLMNLSVLHVPTLRWGTFVVILLCIVHAFLRYDITIKNETISYCIQLFGFQIYSKVLHFQTIQQVTFKRIGWTTKLALIKPSKGISLRVGHFKEMDVYNNLEAFCHMHAIQIVKTKDYITLEKITSNSI